MQVSRLKTFTWKNILRNNINHILKPELLDLDSFLILNIFDQLLEHKQEPLFGFSILNIFDQLTSIFLWFKNLLKFQHDFSYIKRFQVID